MANTETALAGAFARAGMNTASARLRSIAIDALKKHHRNISRALPTFEQAVEDDPDLIREALLQHLCRVDAETAVAGQVDYETQVLLAGDRHPPHANQNSGAVVPAANGGDHKSRGAQQTAVSLVREPSQSQIAAETRARTQTALTVFDRVKTARGVMWGNVYYRELDSLMEDGDLARVVRAHIGSRRGDERNKQVRDLMTPLQFHACMRKIGRSENA